MSCSMVFELPAMQAEEPVAFAGAHMRPVGLPGTVLQCRALGLAQQQVAQHFVSSELWEYKHRC
jgi:hypothetical protein